jgi:ABC-type uncharacterized transport system permease subunit
MDLSLVVLLAVFGLQQGTAIAIAAEGEVITEKSGILNIGIQGVMVVSAFVASAVDYQYGRQLGAIAPEVGLLAGIATGVATNFVFSFMCTKLHVDQVIAGIGINVFGLGLTYVVSSLRFTIDGPPPAATIPPLITLNELSSYQTLSPLVVVMFVLPVLVFLLLRNTKFGLHVRAVGENPRAAEAAGVSVARTRILATSLGGALLGMGGSYLTVDLYNPFVPLVWTVSAVGFIALAAVIAGGWNPFYAMGMSIVFGISLGATHLVSQTSAGSVYAIEMIPYIMTIVVLAIASKRLRPPSALALPYQKE